MAPACPNGQRDPIEDCDGSDLGGETCESLGKGSGQLGCTNDCKYDLSNCGGCGNGQIDDDELCDGSEFGEESCESLGRGDGPLGCSEDCDDLDVSSCEVDVACEDLFLPCGIGIPQDPERPWDLNLCVGICSPGLDCDPETGECL
jgi:hypothetical protein